MQITKTVYLMLSPYGNHVCNLDEMTEMGYVTIGRSEVSFEVDEYDETQLAIQGLEAVLKQTQAEGEMKCNQIKQRIADLKSIGHKP